MASAASTARTGTDRGAGADPAAIMALFVAVHVVAWTAIPGLLHDGLPLDVVEAQAIGREWVLGTVKHPAMPSWLLELSRIVTGRVGWPAFLLSSLSIAATYACLYGLAVETLGRTRALSATLPAAGIAFFSWVTPEFNHNVLQMPLWVATVWLLWRARSHATVASWCLLGAMAALGLYAKLSTAVILATAALFVGSDQRCRRQLTKPAPWLGLVVFALCSGPLLSWLFGSGSGLLAHTETRITSRGLGATLTFPLKQALAALGMIAILAFATRLFAHPSSQDEPAETIHADARRYLLFMFAVPYILVMVTAIPLRIGLRGAWGATMLTLAAPAAMALLDNRCGREARRRAVQASFAVLLAIPAVYAVYHATWPTWTKDAPKVAWPQAAIARKMEGVWQARMGRPLRYVVGDPWSAGMVSVWASSRPSLLIDGVVKKSPWIDPVALKRKGALVVWAHWRESPPPTLRHLIGSRIDGTETFVVKPGRPKSNLIFHYTFLPPAAH